jgi:MIP family channel proteins
VERYVKPAVAELVGMFAFVFIGAGSIVSDTYTHGSVGLLGIALAHGLILAIMISVFGATSGGHFNPAVTVGFLVTRRIKVDLAALYIAAQLVGAILGGLALRAVFAESVWKVSHLGTPVLGPNVSVGAGLLVEAILTFFLLLAVFGTAVDARAPKIAGFGIGLTVTADVFVGGPLTGAAMNPAIAFGPAVASGYFTNHLIYWVGPLIGGIVGALLYNYIILREEQIA